MENDQHCRSESGAGPGGARLVFRSAGEPRPTPPHRRAGQEWAGAAGRRSWEAGRAPLQDPVYAQPVEWARPGLGPRSLTQTELAR